VPRFLFFAALIGVFWSVDAYAFRGRYGTALWQLANHEAQIFNSMVRGLISKVSP
jgi:hypothetical protein